MSEDSVTNGEAQSIDPTPAWNLRSVVPVWVVSVIAAALIVWLVPLELAEVWLPVGLAGAAILTFVIQLALERKEGLVNRVIASLCGALVIFAIAMGVAYLLRG